MDHLPALQRASGWEEPVSAWVLFRLNPLQGFCPAKPNGKIAVENLHYCAICLDSSAVKVM